MRKLYENEIELKNAIRNYLNNNEYRTPRHFRTSLGITKYNLSTWKKTQPEYYNLIKDTQDLILAELEVELIKIGKGVYENRTNPVGIIFMLRAYDKEQYIPESREIQQAIQLPTIVIDNANSKKGKQSGRTRTKIK